jgi:hypothetical protein
MAFSDSTKTLAMTRANNQCECTRSLHFAHTG